MKTEEEAARRAEAHDGSQFEQLRLVLRDPFGGEVISVTWHEPNPGTGFLMQVYDQDVSVPVMIGSNAALAHRIEISRVHPMADPDAPSAT